MHSHVDHYGGVRGLVSDQDLQSGNVQIVAPVGFTEAAVGENIIAGNAMGRRARYMYGLVPAAQCDRRRVGQDDVGKHDHSGYSDNLRVEDGRS